MAERAESKTPSDRTRRHYNLLSTFYDPFNGLFYDHAHRAAVASLQAEPGDVVLEVACGTGMTFEYSFRS